MNPTTDEHPTRALAAAGGDRRCSACGAAADSPWAFCGDCGAVLGAGTLTSAPGGTNVQTPASVAVLPVTSFRDNGGRLRHDPAVTGTRGPIVGGVVGGAVGGVLGGTARLRTVVLVAVLLLALAGAVAATLVHRQTLADLDSTRARLSSAEDRVVTTSRERDRARTQLAESRTELQSTVEQLATAEADLADTQEELSTLRSTLDDARGRLDLQSNQIATLKSCLNGVSEALNAVAYDDYAAALAALEAVEVSCERAFELF